MMLIDFKSTEKSEDPLALFKLTLGVLVPPAEKHWFEECIKMRIKQHFCIGPQLLECS